MWTDATTGTPRSRAKLTARWPEMSGLATWKMLGWKARMSRLTDGGSPIGILYSLRRGTEIEGTWITSPLGGKAGSATVGE